MIGDAGLAEYNNLYDTGHLQSDGAMIQFMEDQQMVQFVGTIGCMTLRNMGQGLIIVEMQMVQIALCITTYGIAKVVVLWW